MEMGFSNFLYFWLLQGSLTIRAPRTPSSPPLYRGRFAHYLVSASLIKEAVIVAAPCHKSRKTFSVKESVHAAFMILYSTSSACFSCLLPFGQHHLCACLLLSVTTLAQTSSLHLSDRKSWASSLSVLLSEGKTDPKSPHVVRCSNSCLFPQSCQPSSRCSICIIPGKVLDWGRELSICL